MIYSVVIVEKEYNRRIQETPIICSPKSIAAKLQS